MTMSKVQSLVVHHLQDGKFWADNIFDFYNIHISLWTLQVILDEDSPLYMLSICLKVDRISMLRWKNDEIEVIRSNNPQVGKALVLAVRHRGRSK